MPDLILIGGGEHAVVVADAARSSGRTIAGYADRAAGARVERACGLTWLGTDAEAARSNPNTELILAMGNIQVRTQTAARLVLLGVRFGIVIHPRAVVASSVTIGNGTAVLAGAVVNPGAKIGNHVIVNTSSIIEHDVQVGHLTHVAPATAIGGGAHIGERTMLGLGSRIRDHISVGDDVVVGMGAVVVTDVISKSRVFGVPATPSST